MATNIYGTYDPYSADNLQGYGLMSSQETPVEQVEGVSSEYLQNRSGGGNGYTSEFTGERPTSLFGGTYELERALGPLASLGTSAAKNTAQALAMGADPTAGLSATLSSSPFAIGKGISNAAGFGAQDTQSKIASMIAKAGLGLMGGPAGMVASPLVDAGISFGMDALDARTNESVRDDAEDSELGEIGGRRGWADTMSQMQNVSKDWSVDAETVADMLNDYAKNQEVVQGVPFTDKAAYDIKMGTSALTELLNAMSPSTTGFGGAGSQSDWNTYGTGQTTLGNLSYTPGNERASSYSGNSGGNGGSSSSGGTSSDNNSAGDQSSNDGIGGR